jgi:aspartyl-tRNA(Asn)/glutamyl-tRNA(Gln) amidotransferase subunit A
MCEISIGTDTGGSVRIPASLCGLVGFKPSRQRVPTDGAFPLSYTLDSIGPIARSVADCASADWVMADAVTAGEEFSFAPLAVAGLKGLRFGVAEGLPLDGLDETVASAFTAAVKRLDGAGVRVSRETLPLFDDMNAVNAKGGISPPEACAIHRDWMGRRPNDIDPNVQARIARGCAVSAADYVDMMRARARLVRVMDARLAGLDALIMPTTSIVAPTIAEVADPKVFAVRNAALLRNTAIINFFDLCAVTLPLPVAPPAMPVGLMVVVRNGHDRRLLSVAAALATLFFAA